MKQIIEINRGNFASKELRLNDAKIISTSCDYLAHLFSINFDVSNVPGIKAKSCATVFKGVKQLDMSLVEPLVGPGDCLASFSLQSAALTSLLGKYSSIWQQDAKKPDLDSAIQMRFKFKSGDEINVISESLTVEYVT